MASSRCSQSTNYCKSTYSCTQCSSPRDSCPLKVGGERVRYLEEIPLCGIENCNIYGGHDEPFNEPKYPKNKRRPRKGFEGPIGLLVCESKLLKADSRIGLSESLHFATILKAFAKVYTTPEIKWNQLTIINILLEGEQLFKDSKMYAPDEDDDNKEVYSKGELLIKREFDMNGHVFHIELSDKFGVNPLDTRLSHSRLPPEEEFDEEEEGFEEHYEIESPDLPLSELKSIISAFFNQYKYCLLKCKKKYYLVWVACGAYFFLDLFGRRTTDLNSDQEQGLSVLMCMKSIKDLLFLITDRSNIKKTDQFNVREIKVVSLTTPDGRTQSNEFGIRAHQFEVVKSDYAFLRSNLHLSLRRRDPLRYRSALPVGIAAILASKIDHPATWNKKMLDKLICYGVNLCRNCWVNCMSKDEPIDLTQYPNELRMGQFWITYQMTPVKYKGFWKCVTNYESTELYIALKSAFDNGDDKLLLQIGSQMYAIWKKGCYYYLFDPYRHRLVGLVEPKDDKSASLRMFGSFETFISILNNMLLQNTRSTRFYIHSIKIKTILLAENLKHHQNYAFADTGLGDDIVEAMSVNDYICFSEDLPKCLDLAIISDVEEEEEDIPISEYKEEELPMEEEEGEGEEMEILLDEGLESASTGDERSFRRKNKNLSQKKGKSKSKDKSKAPKSQATVTAIDTAVAIDTNTPQNKPTDSSAPQNKPTDATISQGKPTDTNVSQVKPTDTSGPQGKPGEINVPQSKPGDTTLQQAKPVGTTVPQSKPTDVYVSQGKVVPGTDPKEMSEGAEKIHPEPFEKEPLEPLEPKEKKESQKSTKPPSALSPKSSTKQSPKKNQSFTSSFEARRNKTSDDTGMRKMRKVCDFSDEDEAEKITPVCDDDDGKHGTGYVSVAHDMIVVGSESGTYESICGLLRSGFKCADRVLCMTPWGNFVVFRAWNYGQKIYFVFDGCTCNINRFRYLEMSSGTSGMMSFARLSDVVNYMIDCQKIRATIKENRERMVDDMCRQYAV